jgi:hypothetical protein
MSERDEELDPEMLRDVLRRRVMRGMVTVVRKLERAARGRPVFGDDHERLACLAIMRLAPAVVAEVAFEANRRPGYHRSNTPEQAAALLARLRRHRAAHEAGKLAELEPVEEQS